jgi:hypothetical protein
MSHLNMQKVAQSGWFPLNYKKIYIALSVPFSILLYTDEDSQNMLIAIES